MSTSASTGYTPGERRFIVAAFIAGFAVAGIVIWLGLTGHLGYPIPGTTPP